MMRTIVKRSPRRTKLNLAFATLLLISLAASPATVARAEAPAAAPAAVPKNADQLREFETRAEDVVAKCIPATVAVLAGPAMGSGVIVTKDGWVLTAGHVAGETGRRVTLVLSDGRRV